MRAIKKYTVADLGDRGFDCPIIDPLFNVAVISRTDNPNELMYAAMHQDYSADQIIEHNVDERDAGRILVNKLLKGDRGHFGVLEHPSMTFSTGFFPHSVLSQARTHRISISFDVQSFRYSSDSIIRAGQPDFSAEAVERAFYLRPMGSYLSRSGKKYTYTRDLRYQDVLECWDSAKKYVERFNLGFSEEHCRGKLPHDYRQHYYFTVNLRSALHFLDLRAKADAQAEIQTLSNLVAMHIQDWCPEIWDYYAAKRYKKAHLSP